MSSLPPALAARLAKRGLIGAKSSATIRPANNPLPEIKFEEEEEVIAEDYDDDRKKVDPLTPSSSAALTFDCKIRDTVPGCPNKYNIYHNCTGYCAQRYAEIPAEPSKAVKRKFIRLLKKYPIKDSSIWEQIYEPGLKTFYFWNTKTDQVSWLPPSHPDARITLPAEKLRRLLRDDVEEEEIEDDDDDDDDDDHRKNDSEEEEEEEDEEDSSSEMDSDSSADPDDDDDDDERRSKSKMAATSRLQAKRRREMISKRNQLDPMDPAAYSDIPRGKWSDGLHSRHDD